MKYGLFFVFFLSFFACHFNKVADSDTHLKPEYAIVIHGGAGNISKKNIPPEKEKEYRQALDSAITIGEKILKEGGSSLDAVERTINYLENNPLFNAGKGAVFTHEGKNEMDASIMDGSDLNAGAVGGVTIVKNPITAARAVMEKSKHVLLTGVGANQFAKEQGLEIVSPDYFFTQKRWDYLQKVIEAEKNKTGAIGDFLDSKFGTVGCVALDKNGHLAAGTSTGGMTNKRYNRIGDSPIIGAGTYADDKTCGVSCTGHGEFFIRYAVAHDISARMAYLHETVEVAADFVINKKLKTIGGSGGVIAIDKGGNITMPFNTTGMFRAWAKAGKKEVLIFRQ